MVGVMDSFKVKGLMFRNRFVMPPMYTRFATRDGAVTDNLINHYVERARAIGLLIVEHSYISLEGKVGENQIGISDDKLIDGLDKLVSRIHAEGTPIIVQINHGGKKTNKAVTGCDSVAPSATEDSRELQVEELEWLADSYAAAARRAMRAGFDGIEVHGAHGFLLNQFYSPLTNKRSDKYGGSLENRIRFPLEVVEKVKEIVGGRLLLYRLGAVDLDPEGTQIEDSKLFAIKLEKSGVDIIDVSGGMCGSRPIKLQGIQGYFLPEAQQIREVVSIPVIGVGGITDAEYADKVVRERRVDLVAVGRKLLNDPDWVAKAIKLLTANQSTS